MGASEEIVGQHERALAIRERALGPEHPEVAASLSSLGRALFELGRIDEAQAPFERALRIWDATVGPEHPARAYTLLGLAHVALAQGRTTDAVERAEQALQIRSASGAPTVELAEARFMLAQARWAVGGDRPEAIALAEQARNGFRDRGHAERAGEVDAWLASHRASAEDG
jgi:serine/threonine-protein kinase